MNLSTGFAARALLSVCPSLVIVLALAGACDKARADEQIRPLAASGDWMALAHSPNMTSPPDVCVVAEVTGFLGMRADDEGHLEVRLTDHNWSLPADVKGTVSIVIGNWHTSLDIAGNTNDYVVVPLAPDVLRSMFTAMDKASSMTVTVGSAKARTVSLVGSTKATGAFRTCIGINGSSEGGENPFQ